MNPLDAQPPPNGMLQTAAAVAQATSIKINLPLFRLALIGGMLPTGDHTFHEIMTACQMFDPSLRYDNSHLRYRLIEPLVEDELRALATDKKFPDELLEAADVSKR